MAIAKLVKCIKVADIEKITNVNYLKLNDTVRKQWDGIIENINIALTKHDNPKRDISTPNRLRHFLTQALHETGSFVYLTEIASGKAYEGRKDLGNIHPGDGVKHKGRGIFQITGLAAYIRLANKYGWDLINHPELLAEPDKAVIAALDYWEDRNFNKYADLPDNTAIKYVYGKTTMYLSPVQRISYGVNGGSNGLQSRMAIYARTGIVNFEMI